jgi:hypothetical protein
VAATIQENVDIQAFTLYNMGIMTILQVNRDKRYGVVTLFLELNPAVQSFHSAGGEG